jgi:tetratricopeptide (TPR) repeat protein
MSSKIEGQELWCWMLAAAVVFATAGAAQAHLVYAGKPDRRALVNKLINYQFGPLDSELSGYEAKAEQDPSQEMAAQIAFMAFDSTSTLIGSRVDDWVKASPNSYAAAECKAIVRLAWAWSWRAKRDDSQMPPGDLARMFTYLNQSAAESKRALTIHPGFLIAYAQLIRAYRVGRDTKNFLAARDDAMANVPASFAAREQIMYGLSPQWGGSLEAMKNFAAASQSYTYRNPSIRFLNAMPVIDAADEQLGSGQAKQALELYNRAIEVGGEYWTTYRHRARCYWDMHSWRDAYNDAMHANELFPEESELLWTLSFTAARNNDPGHSLLWGAEYLRFEQPNASVFRVIQWDQQQLKAAGKL